MQRRKILKQEREKKEDERNTFLIKKGAEKRNRQKKQKG